MAALTPSPSVSTANRIKPRKTLDIWSTREKLCLASAVFKIGNQNWVSVSRALKPYVDPKRPPEWFHQKNCVSHYYDMLEQLEQPKRKRGDRSESDTPSLQIMRKMTIERSEQLKKEIVEMQQTFKQLQAEVEAIKSGQWDDRLQADWDTIKAEQKIKEEADAVKVEVTDETDQEEKVSATGGQEVSTLPVDTDDTTQDSIGENVDITVLTDEEVTQSSTTASTCQSTLTTATPTHSVANKLPSSMLSSLLISEVKSATGLQQLKDEQEHGHQQMSSAVSASSQRTLLKTPITQDDILTSPPSSSKALGQSSTGVTTSSTISTLPTAVIQPDRSTSLGPIDESLAKVTKTDTEKSGPTTQKIDQLVTEEKDVPSSIKTEVVEVKEPKSEEIDLKMEESVDSFIIEEEKRDFGAEIYVDGVETVKEEVDKDSQDEDFDSSLKLPAESVHSEVELTEPIVKDEPLSPTCSISSIISDSGSKRGGRIRGAGRPRGSRLSRFSTRKSNTDDERKDDGGSSRHSDVELSEDEVRETEDLLTGVPLSANASSILSESFPNSPASLSMCSDTEEEKSFKQWKKSIMLVWRAAATHKYANVFLHPVTDEIAPGYRSVVLRPMDLSTIKKNLETGVIRTTVEFQRDMMLMFSNAIMYNSSDHNVYRMAQEMYDDVMQHIEQYVNTQIMVQNTDSKNLRQSRRPDAPDKEDESKKRRLSVDHSEGGKSKKRKTRLDESLP